MERIICTVKERTRCDPHNMPYKKFPKSMVVSYLELDINWINALPKRNRISKTPSPKEILLGTPQIDATNDTL